MTLAGDGAAFGAVYRPLWEIVPHDEPLQPEPESDQVTAVLVVPVTEAVNCCVEFTAVETLEGVSVTATDEGATPVPESATERLGVTEELLPICRLPLAAPAVAGLNCTVRMRLCPAFKVTGKDTAASVKPLPAALAEFTRTALLPEFETVTV